MPIKNAFISASSNNRSNVRITERLCASNYCCRGNAMTITYADFVSIALVVPHAKRMRLFLL